MNSHRFVAAAVIVSVLGGCSAARFVGKPPAVAVDRSEFRTVVIEPFFEDANWQDVTRTETVTGYGTGVDPTSAVLGGLGTGFGGGFGGGGFGSYNGPTSVEVTRHYSTKPAYAQVQALAEEQRREIQAVHALRPTWQVLSTGDLPAVNGRVTLVRVIVGPSEVVGGNRTLKYLCLGFGIVIWPLLVYDFWPVDETQRVRGVFQKFDLDAALLRTRLLRYPTQPDFAVDVRGFPGARAQFGLDIAYQEGVLAKEELRGPALIAGLPEMLASEIVRFVEANPPP